MNPKDITAGLIYSDGKLGLRKVVSVGDQPFEVRYEILAAKIEREYISGGSYRSVIGCESSCSLESFAKWAKNGHSESEGQEVLMSLQAGKVKHSPGEAIFMRSVLEESGVVGPGTYVSYNHMEGRAVAGLEKKALLRRDPRGGEAAFTELGLAKIKLMPSVQERCCAK